MYIGYFNYYLVYLMNCNLFCLCIVNRWSSLALEEELLKKNLKKPEFHSNKNKWKLSITPMYEFFLSTNQNGCQGQSSGKVLKVFANCCTV